MKAKTFSSICRYPFYNHSFFVSSNNLSDLFTCRFLANIEIENAGSWCLFPDLGIIYLPSFSPSFSNQSSTKKQTNFTYHSVARRSGKPWFQLNKTRLKWSKRIQMSWLDTVHDVLEKWKVKHSKLLSRYVNTLSSRYFINPDKETRKT